MTTSSRQHHFKCPVCGMGQPNLKQLNQHVLTHDYGRDYSCFICKKIFNSVVSLQRHQVVHTKEKKYHCSFCSKAFGWDSQLRLHERTHTGQGLHQCSVCGKGFMTKWILNRHMTIHSRTPLICLICNVRFIKVTTWQDHMMNAHGQDISQYLPENQPALPSDQPLPAASEQESNSHNIIPDEDQLAECISVIPKNDGFHEDGEDDCIIVDDNAAHNSVEHTMETMPNPIVLQMPQFPPVNLFTPNKEGPTPVCFICGVQFQTKYELYAHYSSHDNSSVTGRHDKVYMCIDCGKCFGWKSMFTQHQKLHIGIGLSNCKYCGKGFTNRWMMKRHEGIHTRRGVPKKRRVVNSHPNATFDTSFSEENSSNSTAVTAPTAAAGYLSTDPGVINVSLFGSGEDNETFEAADTKDSDIVNNVIQNLLDTPIFGRTSPEKYVENHEENSLYDGAPQFPEPVPVSEIVPSLDIVKKEVVDECIQDDNSDIPTEVDLAHPSQPGELHSSPPLPVDPEQSFTPPDLSVVGNNNESTNGEQDYRIEQVESDPEENGGGEQDVKLKELQNVSPEPVALSLSPILPQPSTSDPQLQLVQALQEQLQSMQSMLQQQHQMHMEGLQQMQKQLQSQQTKHKEDSNRLQEQMRKMEQEIKAQRLLLTKIFNNGQIKVQGTLNVNFADNINGKI